MSLTDPMVDAYSAAGPLWQGGPGRVYDRLAEALIAHSPGCLVGATVVDVGAGTGAAARAARRAGASHVIAVDVAAGMVATLGDADVALVADARDLPLRAAAADVVVAAFSYNHLPDPGAAFAEARRVLRPGGAVIAGSYAADDSHPAKAVVEDVLAAHGWRSPQWYREVQTIAAGLATPAGCRAAAVAGGLAATVHAARVPFPELTHTDLVAWRLGMAHIAPFVVSLQPARRAEVVATAVRRLEGAPPLLRSILITTAVVEG